MLPFVLAAATAAAAAAVPTGSTPTATDLDAPHRVRKGVMLGLSFGGGLVGASGYPNDVTRIGDPAYYSATGFMYGTSESVFVMGALTDYLSFGFWFTHATDANKSWTSTGDGGGLRVEAFPFAVLFPRLAGLGVAGQFGVGSGKLTSKTPGLPNAAGTSSFAGAGVFYEWAFWELRHAHFAAGPALEYDAIWSQPFERHGLVASARLVFYGGP
ncbi:MAG TPA: hypothetical protein VGM06_00820 [Polyangiaceae bacterium]|jgi:hypothetical protein